MKFKGLCLVQGKLLLKRERGWICCDIPQVHDHIISLAAVFPKFLVVFQYMYKRRLGFPSFMHVTVFY